MPGAPGDEVSAVPAEVFPGDRGLRSGRAMVGRRLHQQLVRIAVALEVDRIDRGRHHDGKAGHAGHDHRRRSEKRDGRADPASQRAEETTDAFSQRDQQRRRRQGGDEEGGDVGRVERWHLDQSTHLVLPGQRRRREDDRRRDPQHDVADPQSAPPPRCRAHANDAAHEAPDRHAEEIARGEGHGGDDALEQGGPGKQRRRHRRDRHCQTEQRPRGIEVPPAASRRSTFVRPWKAGHALHTSEGSLRLRASEIAPPAERTYSETHAISRWRRHPGSEEHHVAAYGDSPGRRRRRMRRRLGAPDARGSPRRKGLSAVEIDGTYVVDTRGALRRLGDEFPGLSAARLRVMLVAEWEASTGGVPLVIPADVEEAVRERLQAGSLVDVPRSRRR